MRIAQVATLGTPVRRDGSGSIEQIVWLLSRELTELGHDVTVFGVGGSKTPGDLVALLPGPYGCQGAFNDWQLCEWTNLCHAVQQSDRFDVIHCHAYLWGLPLQPLARAPMIHTLHVMPTEDSALLRTMFPAARITALSHHQWAEYPELPAARVIWHGIDEEQFTFQAHPGDYACYLGRFLPEKGALIAIKAARSLGLRLLLAGPQNDYYRKAISQHVDGKTVEYVGYASGVARDRLLGGARALLYPVTSPEPFGLVIAEAMMCGTPVAALRVGAVGELVDEGITGCCAATAEDYSGAVLGALSLDRGLVRQQALARFSARRMALAYLEEYESLIGSSNEPYFNNCASS